MKNKFKILWLIFSVTLFLISSSLSFSDIWRDFNLLWSVSNLWEILFYGFVAICFGLLLALCLFRKQPYKRRILVTISISIILLSICQLIGVAVFKYGLREQYNYFTAKRDI